MQKLIQRIMLLMFFCKMCIRDRADADVLLYVTDVIENPEKNMEFLEKVKKMQIPVLFLINKIDQSDPKKLGDIVEKWHSLLRCV